MLFRNGWNAVQVQKFLGHADPGFSLSTYVDLLPQDLPDPRFLEALTSISCDQDATHNATRTAQRGIRGAGGRKAVNRVGCRETRLTQERRKPAGSES
jgi:hypothetical protein